MKEYRDPSDIAALFDLVPDEPRWVDLKGLLRSARCRVWAEEEPRRGFVARSVDERFAIAWGESGKAALSAATAGARRDFCLLAAEEAAERVAAVLPGWRSERFILHRLEGEIPAVEVPPGVEIVMLAPLAPPVAPDLAGLPAALRAEIVRLLATVRPLVVAREPRGDGGKIVAYCGSMLTTDTLWDVAVETLPGHRRRGLAAACFAHLARWLATERDLRPVWGADESNDASLALAAKLGFVRDSELLGFQRAKE